jgi:uncharacterized protein (TIGR02147 family)
MAKQLDLAPSALSELISGRRRLSPERASQVANKLGLESRESEYFFLLAQLEQARDFTIKESILKRLQALKPLSKIQALDLDAFKAISDWYHLAILHLCDQKNFVLTAKEASARLGISTFEAEAAIERLIRLDALTQDESGALVRAKNVFANSAIPNEALRRFHRQTLEKAIASIDEQLPQEKFIGSETFAINASRIEEANEILEECFSRMVQLFETDSNKTDVYHLGIQFFRLTRPLTKGTQL